MKAIEWQPNRGPQRQLFSCPATVILYGGAKAGGKTEAALVWAVANGFDKDGYRAVIFRRTFPELERKIIPRSHELFSGVGKYDTRNHQWTFPTPAALGSNVSVGGQAVLEFAYLERELDVHKYDGAEYARIAFDESTRFSENQVRYILTCLRSPVEGIRRQMLLATNPIGSGFSWHYELFIKNRQRKASSAAGF